MNSVIIDNWTLQDIGALVADGYGKRTIQSLIVQDRAHTYEPVLEGELQLSAMVDMLTNIVLYTDVRLDDRFKSAWEGYEGIFQPMLEADLVKYTDPPKSGDIISQGTSYTVKQLCVTPGLSQVQKENEESFAQDNYSVHGYESQIMWGGAGMLSRSNAFSLPYVGHPLRQRFIESTGIFTPQRDATREVIELVKEQRASIYTTHIGSLDVVNAQLTLPAVAIEVIMAAESKTDLIRIAVEKRDKHKKLREWLQEFRTALILEDTVEVMKYKKQLNLLVRDVDRLTGKSPAPSMSFGMSLSGPGLSYPLGELLRSVTGKFTIRHDLMKQVKAPSSEIAMKKLRRMFS